jgi:hypothetical protein
MQFTVISSQFSVRDGLRYATICLNRKKERKHSTRMRPSLVHRLDQAREHSFDFADSGVQDLKLSRHEKVQVPGQDRIVLKLIRRPKCNVEELAKLRICRAPAAFSNIRRDGECCSSYLTRQPEELLARKHRSDVVDAQRQSVALLPNFQFSVVLHRTSSRDAFAVYYYTIILYTIKLSLPARNSEPDPKIGNCKTRTENTIHSAIPFSFLHCELKTDNCKLTGAGHAS